MCNQQGTTIDGVFDFTRQKGYFLVSGEELFERGFPRVLADLRDCLADRPVFLCFDMDFLDPPWAPGVCTPTWGGASAREGLGLLKEARRAVLRRVRGEHRQAAA